MQEKTTHKRSLIAIVILSVVILPLSFALAFSSGNGKTATDTTPPVIGDVSAQGIGTTGATIAWTTDEDSSSLVEYGVSDKYGSQTPIEVTLVKTHAIALSSLTPGTTYYYRVISSDGAGNSSQSSRSTFKTLGDFTITNVTGRFVPWAYAGNYQLQSLSITVKNTKDVTMNVAGGQFYLGVSNAFTFTTSQAIPAGDTGNFSVSTSVNGVTAGPKQLSLTLKDSQGIVLATYSGTVSP